MISETTIYYEKRKKDIFAYCFEMSLFRCAFFVFFGPFCLIIFTFSLLLFVLDRYNPVFIIFMGTGLGGFLLSLLIFSLVFLLMRQRTKSLFARNDVICLSLVIKDHHFDLKNNETGHSYSFVFSDIKSVEYHKKTIIIKVKNNSFCGFILFPNLHSIRIHFVKTKK